MARLYITDIDLSQNEIKNVVVQKISTSQLSSKVEGQIWYDTSSKELWYYNGTSSQEVLHISPSSDSIGAVKISDTVESNDSRVWSDHIAVSPKAVNDVRTVLDTRITTESGVLSGLISSETSSRINEDDIITSNVSAVSSALNDRITVESGVLSGLISSETSSRVAEDNVLSGNIVTVSTALDNRITTESGVLSGLISAETTSRINAVTTEETARQNLDTSINAKLLNSKTRILNIKDYDFTENKQNIKNRPVVTGNKLIKAIFDIVKEHSIYDIDETTQVPTLKGNALGMEYPVLIKAGDCTFGCAELVETENENIQAVYCVGLDIDQTTLSEAIQEYQTSGGTVKTKIDAIIPNFQRVIFLYDKNSGNTYTFFSESTNISQFVNDKNYAVETKFISLNDYLDSPKDLSEINGTKLNGDIITEITKFIGESSTEKRSVRLTVGATNEYDTFTVIDFNKKQSTLDRFVSCVRLSLERDASGTVTNQIPHVEKLILYYNNTTDETYAYYSTTEKLEYFDNTTAQFTNKTYVDNLVSTSLIGALKYKGKKNIDNITTGATSYNALFSDAELPLVQGYMYYIEYTKTDPKTITIDGIEWANGDYLIFKNDTPITELTTPITSTSIDKIDNTEKEDIIRMSMYRPDNLHKQVENLFLSNAYITCEDGEDYTKTTIKKLPLSSFNNKLTTDYKTQIARKYSIESPKLYYDSTTNTITWKVMCRKKNSGETVPQNTSFMSIEAYADNEYPVISNKAVIAIYKISDIEEEGNTYYLYEEVMADVQCVCNDDEDDIMLYFKVIMNSNKDLPAGSYKAILIG